LLATLSTVVNYIILVASFFPRDAMLAPVLAVVVCLKNIRVSLELCPKLWT